MGDVPSIEGGIDGQVVRMVPQGGDRLSMDGLEMGDVLAVEGLGVIGQHHIAVHRVGGAARRDR